MPDNPLNLLHFYLIASYRNPLEINTSKVPLGFPINQKRFFRTYKMKDLLKQYTMQQLCIEQDIYERTFNFYFYFYTQMVSKAYWDNIEFKSGFCKIKEGLFYIILKEDWFD